MNLFPSASPHGFRFGRRTVSPMNGRRKRSLAGWRGSGLLAGLLFSACASMDPDALPTYTKHNLTLSFPRLIAISDPNQEEYSGGIEDYEIDHPARVSTRQIQNQLRSLWYQPVNPPGRPRPVFSETEAERLAPLFRAGLNKVGPSRYIHFIHRSPRGVTEGEVFGTVDAVHWRFLRIHGIYFEKTFLGTGRATWKLVRTMRGQRYHREKTALAQVTRENWLIVDKALAPFKGPARRASASTSPASAPAALPAEGQRPALSPELEGQLKRLKNLRDQGLIDEEDYRKKKEELLNRYLK